MVFLLCAPDCFLSCDLLTETQHRTTQNNYTPVSSSLQDHTGRFQGFQGFQVPGPRDGWARPSLLWASVLVKSLDIGQVFEVLWISRGVGPQMGPQMGPQVGASAVIAALDVLHGENLLRLEPKNPTLGVCQDTATAWCFCLYRDQWIIRKSKVMNVYYDLLWTIIMKVHIHAYIHFFIINE